MRDPLGTLSIGDDQVIRTLNQNTNPLDFLNQQDAVDLVRTGQLIDFRFTSDTELTHPLIPFISYPHEWSNAQLMSAAELTLNIAELCEKNNWEIKDASAWNVIFEGTQPIFCDHLSFQKINRKNWWAFAQFVRHFIFPLCIAKYAGLNAYESFKLSRDGLSIPQVKSVLGVRRFITRYWPLLVDLKSLHSKIAPNYEGVHRHKNLISLLKHYLNGVRPKKDSSIWSGYASNREHYEQKAQDIKNHKIEEWLRKNRPAWVTDFGCNTGQYTRMANHSGANVIALDLDHECIQQLFVTEQGNKSIYPLIVDLDDIFAGRGWAGSEFSSLMTRISRFNEMSLMLDLIHHLAISNSIPYLKIAEFAKAVTKKWLIVEMLEHEDPLVIHLCNQRDRNKEDFAIQKQIDAFEIFFETVDTCVIEGTRRHLRLLKVRA